MDNNSLTNFYDDLKNRISEPSVLNRPINVGNGGMTPAATAWRNKAVMNAEKLKEGCRKQILLDIYCKILPLDSDYIDRNQGVMKQDIDNMLDQKGMTATQYFKSCSEKTKAPLVEYVLWSTDKIGQKYMEEADETLKKAQEDGINIPEPKEIDDQDEDVQDQLVDIKNDMEYDSFIDILKKKTIDKIVADVSKIINDRKEVNNMTFDTDKPLDQEIAQESAVAVGMNYLQKRLWNENTSLTEKQEEMMIGMAIREAALHQFDVVFNQPGSVFREFVSSIRFNKGIVINESAVDQIKGM